MRRKDREMDKDFALEIIDSCEYAVLSLVSPENEPYGVALNIVRDGEYIYFHSAKAGRKVDCIKANPRGSLFCAGKPQLVPEEFTTLFSSAIVSGSLSEVTEDKEKIHALRLICQRYAPSNMQSFPAAIERSLKVVGIWKMHIDEISGKAKTAVGNSKFSKKF